jgi:predicted nucleotidyltransferase
MPGKRDPRLEKINDPSVRKALNDFEVELKKLFPKNEPVILLFGSYARGQATSESDVDILLLFPYDIHPFSEIQRVSGILAKINLRHQVLISVLPATEYNYHHSKEPFWNHVRREGIPITAI